MEKLNIQPWSGFGDWNSFSVPGNQLKDRVENNIQFYSGNYAIIALVVLLLTLFTNFNLLIAVVILGGIFYVTCIQDTGNLRVGNFVLTLIMRMAIIGVVSIVTIYKISGMTLIYTSAISASAILVHAVFRKRTLKGKINATANKANDFVDRNFN
ncbi:hypothetical protein CYY_009013 [Polysphondylium violaceum]|uniref:PRA1 family protein n=1 Tax=Polysphondylium violaceum TaxID=133409 RepID=A0A8J4PMM9_9MYCE|nr:hypothetical protein CYY_009013 [Polysphondylium violaceum]